MFFSIFLQVIKPSSPLSAFIDPLEVTINTGTFWTCNTRALIHAPRVIVTVTVSKPVLIVDSSVSCLYNCSEQDNV